MPFATNANCRIYWRLQGAADKPVIVMLNSIGTDYTLYDDVAPKLVNDFQLLRIDTRGHGASDAPTGDYTLDLLADDVLAVMDAAGVKKAILCGISLGGMMAMKIALKAPSRVEALILAFTSSVMDPAFWIKRVSDVRANGMASIADAAISRLFSEEFFKADKTAINTARNVLVTMSGDGYAGCGAAIRDMNLLPDLPTISVPTLVLGGDMDTATPFEGNGDKIAAAIPGAQSAVLHAGHLGSTENPEAFAAAVRTFLANSALVKK